MKIITALSGFFKNFSTGNMKSDLLAGLTSAAVIVPGSIAYASIAGLPVEMGLYTALIPMIIYALTGSSQVMMIGPTSTMAVLIASQLFLMNAKDNHIQITGVAITLAFLVGCILLAASVLRLGFIANFLSLPVVTGFKCGIGFSILVDQMGKILGVQLAHGLFFDKLWSIILNIPSTHIPTLVVALISIVILFGLPKVLPQISSALVAVFAGIAGSLIFNLQSMGIALTGYIPPGLPSFSLPVAKFMPELLPGAVGIALICFTESTAVCRAFTRSSDPSVNSNRELFALGLSNIAGSFFMAFPSGGGTSQTAVNYKAGAVSRLSGVVVAVIVVLTLLFLSPFISIMPLATLGAIVFWVAIGMIMSVSDILQIYKVRRTEAVWALAALAGVLVLGTLKGILVAVVISVVTLIYHSNHPSVYILGRKRNMDVFRQLKEDSDDETFPGLLMAKIEGRLHFASAPQAGEKMKLLLKEQNPKVLLLDCSAIPDIEYSALISMTDLEKKLEERGITLWLAGLNPEPLKLIDSSTLGKKLGRERMFFNMQKAVEAWHEKNMKKQ
jgi:high affinity sulfate transporter 1